MATVLALMLLTLLAPTIRAEQRELQDTQLVQTDAGRQLLKYLVSCALAPDVTVTFAVAGQAYVLAGGLGLAPLWLEKSLSLEEEKTLSACIFARTNSFGKTVQLSLRGDSAHRLQTDAAERASFPFFEAAFFGNLFRDQPESYVCIGDALPQREEHLESLLRVCSLLPARGLPGAQASRCGFTVVGACKDRPFVQNGQDFSNSALRVYLPNPK
jgi:hypothetical protein